MKRLALVLLITIGIGLQPLAAQNQSFEAEKARIQAEAQARQQEEQRNWETKLFPIKYVDPNELMAALSMFRAEMRYSGGGLQILSVRAPKEMMPAIEDAIKRLDMPMPRKDAELTIFVLLASDQDGPLPGALQPLVKQPRNVLAYKGYQLVDTLITRGSSANARTNSSLTGVLPSQPPAQGNVSYEFRSELEIRNPDGKEPLLRLTGMQFSLTIPGDPLPPPSMLRIATDVEVPRGQQIVVGKATFKDRAYILVMSAKFD